MTMNTANAVTANKLNFDFNWNFIFILHYCDCFINVVMECARSHLVIARFKYITRWV